MKSPDISRVVDIFLTLPPEDQEEIFQVGATFRRIDLEKQIARAQERLRQLETKYGITLEELERQGLPDDADYEMHEDYVEWHYWATLLKKAQQTLDLLADFSRVNE